MGIKNDQITASIEKGNRQKGYQTEIQNYLKNNPRTIVILDDDPTGTQTVQNIPVITNWTETALERELLRSPVFFVLTNSRALQRYEAEQLAETIGSRLKKLSQNHAKKLIVVSRSDSTLRGHYPNEVEVLGEALGMSEVKHALIPAFFEGGRYTFEDVHYVQEAKNFVPSGQTAFAQDSTFGYIHSNLRNYILEKYKGRMEEEKVTSLAIETLRSGSVENELNKIITDHHCIVVNATSHVDLEAFALAALKSEAPLLFRTAASFVNAISGSRPSLLLKKKDFKNNKNLGGLTIIGSYVPKTTAQLMYLKQHFHAEYIELDVDTIFEDGKLKNLLNEKALLIDGLLRAGRNVVVYTSRKLRKGNTTEESLGIVNVVSDAITSLIKLISVQPKFILTKGGITSSDVAVKALDIQRALILGQLIKGVPVWQADMDSKFPAIPYIVFPGNVGTTEDLFNVLKKME